jgi:AcrR family transcriptional regulator
MDEAADSEGTRAQGAGTRERIVAAAVRTLKERGFSGASARAIARTGDFNQALIFYHFGSVNDLMLAALDDTSERRMATYREALGEVTTLPGLMAEAARIYREDLESGHIKVLAELIAGASSAPELGPQIVRRVQPWIEFACDAVARVLQGSPLEALPVVEDVAYAVVALYLGVELLTHLNGESARAERLIESGIRLTGLLGPLMGGSVEGSE